MPQERLHVKATSQSASNATTDADIDQAVAEAQARDGSDVVAMADELLDEIDAILTEEADFAIHYLQKGGQ